MRENEELENEMAVLRKRLQEKKAKTAEMLKVHKENEIIKLKKALQNPNVQNVAFQHKHKDKISVMTKNKFIDRYISSQKKEIEAVYAKT